MLKVLIGNENFLNLSAHKYLEQTASYSWELMQEILYIIYFSAGNPSKNLQDDILTFFLSSSYIWVLYNWGLVTQYPRNLMRILFYYENRISITGKFKVKCVCAQCTIALFYVHLESENRISLLNCKKSICKYSYVWERLKNIKVR